MKKHITYIIAASLLLIGAGQASALQVFEQKIEIKAGEVKNYEVMNPLDESVTVKVWAVEKGEQEKLDMEKQAQWTGVKIFPKLVTIPAKSNQVFKIKATAKEGSIGRIYFLEDRKNPEKVQAAQGITLNVRFKVGVPVVIK